MMNFYTRFSLKPLLLFSFLVFSSCGLFLQKKGIKNYKVKLPAIQKQEYNRYQKDFLYMVQLCEDAFPLINNYTDSILRKNMAIEILEELDDKKITENAFIILLSHYMALFQNQHTLIISYPRFGEIFPFQLWNYKEEWQLLNISKKYDSTLIGKKIQRIQHIPVSRFEEMLSGYVSAENTISCKYAIRSYQYYNKPDFLYLTKILSQKDSICLTFDNEEEIWIQNEPAENSEFYRTNQHLVQHPVTATSSSIYQYKLYPEKNLAYFQFNMMHDKIDILESISTYVKPWLQPFARYYVKRQFKKKKPSRVIQDYYDPENPVFKDFIEKMITDIRKNNIHNLIIDLRNNSGGNFVLGKQLMYSLSNKEDIASFNECIYSSDLYKKYFKEDYDIFSKQYKLLHHADPPDDKILCPDNPERFFQEITRENSPFYVSPNRPVFSGNVYILSNYRTGSAAALLTTLLQDNNLATVIGTSVGNNPTGPTTLSMLRLPRTKIPFTIATTYNQRPDTTKGDIQFPDYWVEYSLDDILNGNDPSLEKAMELIQEKE